MFLAYVESILREDEDIDAMFEKWYPQRKTDRGSEIRAALAAFS